MKDLGQAFMSTFKMQPELTVSHEEKFAELIVRECAWVGNKAESSDSEIRSMYEVILTHFGIEE